MVTVISVDVYRFLDFSDLTCHLEDMKTGIFWLHFCFPYSYFCWAWLFLRYLGVICYDISYFKDWYLINSQPFFLFSTYLNLMNFGHIIKST